MKIKTATHECTSLIGSYIQFCFLQLNRRELYFSPKSLAEGIENFHGVIIKEAEINNCLLQNLHFPIRYEDDFLPVYCSYHRQFIKKKFPGNWHKFTFERSFSLHALRAWNALDIVSVLEEIKLI